MIHLYTWADALFSSPAFILLFCFDRSLPYLFHWQMDGPAKHYNTKSLRLNHNKVTNLDNNIIII